MPSAGLEHISKLALRLRVTKTRQRCLIEEKALTMRELTLLETCYLAGLLLLSLVLPLLLSIRNPQNAAIRKSCLRIVWMGQLFGAMAGLTVLASALVAPYAAVFGLFSNLGCAFVLTRQFRVVS